MTRCEAVACVLSFLMDELVVAANGMISREAFFHDDREANFYMIGSMGLASAIGLGIAVAQPDRRVVVFDGDGNVLMALGTLPMVGDLCPPNFVHIVFDNEVYGSTGGQRSISDQVGLDGFALAAGYDRVARVETREALERTIREILDINGPSFLLVKVSPENMPDVPRVSHQPEAIVERFMQAVKMA